MSLIIVKDLFTEKFLLNLWKWVVLSSRGIEKLIGIEDPMPVGRRSGMGDK